MVPREITFTRETVLKAAVELLRQEGWENLSTRKLAERLHSSVAPVYSVFGSMEELSSEVLQKVAKMIEDNTRRSYTDLPFLNIGVGIAVFARDEPNLFRALFHYRHNFNAILINFHDSILHRMKQDPGLHRLSDGSLRRLLSTLWLFTLGLATAIINRQISDSSTENISSLLKNIGNVLIFSEISGIADCESLENQKEWDRLFKQKNISFPSTDYLGS
ncbi:MAG: helix-turn-helix domain-containing protein [Spirochaetota bacterium]